MLPQTFHDTIKNSSPARSPPKGERQIVKTTTTHCASSNRSKESSSQVRLTNVATHPLANRQVGTHTRASSSPLGTPISRPQSHEASAGHDGILPSSRARHCVHRKALLLSSHTAGSDRCGRTPRIAPGSATHQRPPDTPNSL